MKVLINMLLKIIDGGINEIESGNWSMSGCETCDYGSSYVNEYKIHLTQGTIDIKVDMMYDHALTDGHMIQLILPNVDIIKNMTEKEFFEWVKDELDPNTMHDWRVPDVTVEWKAN